MRLRTGTLGFLVFAALAAGAEEQGAPLEKSQRELKTLQRDQATRNSEAGTGKLGDGLPQIQAPVPGALPLELPAAGRTESELKKNKQARKNWLVDGVEKLKKEAKAKDHEATPGKGAAFTGEETKALDSSDPDYVLKLYGEQQQDDAARTGAKHPAPARVDPFAPFLQGWLGGSPVRGKFFDEFTRKPDTNGLTIASANSPLSGVSPGPSGVEPASSTRETSVAGQPNPYLQGLDMPSSQDLKGGLNQPATGPEAWSKPADLSPTVTSPAPLPAVRQADPKLQLPPLADDKKYFPQLKKF